MRELNWKLNRIESELYQSLIQSKAISESSKNQLWELLQSFLGSFKRYLLSASLNSSNKVL